jgi:hypothetical protein
MREQGLIGFESLPPEEQNKELQKIFREVFSTEKGKIVFNVLLDDLHFLRVCKSEEDHALNNYAKVLIGVRMGYTDTYSISNNLLTCEHE